MTETPKKYSSANRFEGSGRMSREWRFASSVFWTPRLALPTSGYLRVTAWSGWGATESANMASELMISGESAFGGGMTTRMTLKLSIITRSA